MMNNYTLNLEQFENFYNYTTLTYQEVEESIQNYDLNFDQNRNNTAENKIRLPPFIKIFYAIIWNLNKTPTQEEFIYHYLRVHNKKLKSLESETYNGVISRLKRTYPSLVRDFHFSLYLKEKIKYATILYNTKLDIEYDIDILLIGKDYTALCLFTKTRRGFEYRNKKTKRHKIFSNVDYIEIELDFKGSKKCGQFFLYGEKELNTILKSIVN